MKRSTMSRRRCRLAVALLSLAVTAGGCSSGERAEESTTTGNAPSSPSTTGAPTCDAGGSTSSSSTTTSEPIDREPTPAEPAQYGSFVDGNGERVDLFGGLAFSSPSGNIHCDIRADPVVEDSRPYAACGASEHEWSVPEEPCELDWSDGVVSLGPDGVTRGACSGDPPVTYGANELPYDRSLTQGPITCVSRRTGVVCTFAGTDHRFRISREELETR
jgi:hypothetical protein